MRRRTVKCRSRFVSIGVLLAIAGGVSMPAAAQRAAAKAQTVAAPQSAGTALSSVSTKKAQPPQTAPHGVRGTNDECSGALTISGTGTFPFDTNAATNSADAGCGAIGSDIWFSWTAPSTGTANVTTCGLTGMDSVLQAWSGCGGTSLACVDDACGLQTTITFPATAGTNYKLRLGGFGAQRGTGSFSISMTAPPPPPSCTQPAGNCHAGDLGDAYNSNPNFYTTADNFVVGTSGSLTGECFWGVYIGTGTDDFTVTYLTDAGGLPGSPIASFSQSGGTLTVVGPSPTGELIVGFPVQEYSTTHAPVAVAAGTSYWLQVTNNIGTGASWYWQQSFADNSSAAQAPAGQGFAPVPADMRFCLSLGLDSPGRCCMSNGTCSIMASSACSAAGGTFGGPGTECGAASYTVTTGTGTVATGTTNIGNVCDDCTTAVALPFPVSLYGTAYNSVNVSSNGNVQFVSTNAAYTNSCLPATGFGPTIFPHWDDQRTDGGGTILTGVSGPAGSRTFVIEFRSLTYFGAAGTVSFSLSLHEGSSNFEVVVGSGDVGSATIGVQDGASSSTQASCNAGVTANTQYSFVYSQGTNPCATCRADINGDGTVNVSDFLAFLQLYAAGDPRADMNGSGSVNVQDFLAYLQLFAAGC
jgi:hypothetical protein